MTGSDNARGALFMVLAMTAYAVNDGIMKLVFQDLPLAQSVFVRGLMATSLILLLCWQQGVWRHWPDRSEWRTIVPRTIGEVGATASFMLVLHNVDLATGTAVLQAAPLAVTMVAAVFLGETVGWRRWSAIAVGFFGMLLIVRPRADFDPWLLVAVGTVGFITLRDIATRRMSARTPTLWVSALSAVAITTCAGVAVPLEGTAPMDPHHFALLAFTSVLILVGYVGTTLSVRVGEVAAVAPFRYTVLVVSLIVGFVMFRSLPDPVTLAGAAIIVFAGLYTLWRERQHMRGPRAEAP